MSVSFFISAGSPKTLPPSSCRLIVPSGDTRSCPNPLTTASKQELPGSYTRWPSRSASMTMAPRSRSQPAAVDLPDAIPPVRPITVMSCPRPIQGVNVARLYSRACGVARRRAASDARCVSPAPEPARRSGTTGSIGAPSAAAHAASGRARLALCGLQRLDQRRDDELVVAHDAEASRAEDVRLPVAVDRDDVLRAAAAGHVLTRARDADGDVQVR